jgi:exonuclease SbcC
MMMPKLNITKLTMRNFKSYGDYDTTIDLSALGPVLIMGEIRGNNNKSNGAGKTTLSDAIIWCLFGRLPNKTRPASHIVNNTIGKDCEVTLVCDGYTITRTRNKEGHHDLLLIGPDGKDITDSTNPNAQKHLNKLFNLDYDIFTSNVFFTQSGQSFLELPDPKRKKAMERMLHLNRFDHYVAVSKEHIDKETEKQVKLIADLESIEQEVLRITKQIERNNDLLKEYEEKRKQTIEEKKAELTTIDGKYEDKIKELQHQLEQDQKKLDQIETYDINKIKKQWEQHEEKKEKLEKAKERLQVIRDAVVRLKTQKESLETKRTDNTGIEISLLESRLEEKIQKLKDMIVFDIDKIKQEWDRFNANNELIKKADKKTQEQEIKLAGITSQLNTEQEQIKQWKERSGEVCPNCKQKISEEHTLEMCEPSLEKRDKLKQAQKKIQSALEKLKKLKEAQAKRITEPKITIAGAQMHNENREDTVSEIGEIKTNITRLRKNSEEEKAKRQKQLEEVTEELNNKINYVSKKEEELDKAESLITDSTPAVTIKEAEARKEQYDAQQNRINSLRDALSGIDSQIQKDKDTIVKDIKREKDKDNPYQAVIDGLLGDLEEVKERRGSTKQKVDDLNKVIKHYMYIKSAYSDRKRIKAHLLSKLIPYFNERIAYYLEAMDCECDLKFSSSLQAKYGIRPYEMWSGGERKKIDLALMFAIHDLHSSMYDQQCNMMVFDEVDGRLDQDGVEKFVEIIFNEVATRCSTIPVISHKDSMRDAFPTKIIVRKNEEDFSFIEEIR